MTKELLRELIEANFGEVENLQITDEIDPNCWTIGWSIREVNLKTLRWFTGPYDWPLFVIRGSKVRAGWLRITAKVAKAS